MNTNMKSYMNALLFTILIFSTQLRADNYLYNAKVEGMVCAFCAYSVSKNISKMPGVDADSVDVDLKAGHVRFTSSQSVNEEKLSALFNDSGFTISQLKQSKIENAENKAEGHIEMTLEFDRNKIQQYGEMLESLGNMAASHTSRLLIEAPVEDESKLLKPILMGRQQVIKVRFSASASNKIVLKLYVDDEI